MQAKLAEKELDRIAATDSWRKLAIHEVLMNSEQFLSVTAITEKLRTESFDVDLQVGKSELSEPSIRKILMEMVAEGTIGQVFPDHYGVAQLPRDISIEAVAENIRASRAARSAFEEIRKHPERYNSKELYEEVGRKFHMTESDFELAILILETNSAASRDQNGKWAPTTTRIR